MSKKLAIKGHPTRGKEVIELLTMLGGNEGLFDTGLRLGGTEVCCVYHIGTGGSIIYSHHSVVNDNFIVFTLEEFLKKYPFKVGDKVVDCYGNTITIKSMEWSEDCETMVYDFKDSVIVLAAEDLLKYNAKQSKMKIVLAELLEHIKTTPKEELEREFEEIEEWSNVGPTVEEFRTFCECVNKKPKYPDNYEECVRIAKNIHGYDIHIDTPAYGELMESFVKLLICRDAYWKIAGEEMRLDKPWEPDWTNLDQLKYCIWVDVGEFITMVNVRGQHILAFPTEEMRDAFYENFKDLIESCKELL